MGAVGMSSVLILRRYVDPDVDVWPTSFRSNRKSWRHDVSIGKFHLGLSAFDTQPFHLLVVDIDEARQRIQYRLDDSNSPRLSSSGALRPEDPGCNAVEAKD